MVQSVFEPSGKIYFDKNVFLKNYPNKWAATFVPIPRVVTALPRFVTS